MKMKSWVWCQCKWCQCKWCQCKWCQWKLLSIASCLYCQCSGCWGRGVILALQAPKQLHHMVPGIGGSSGMVIRALIAEKAMACIIAKEAMLYSCGL